MTASRGTLLVGGHVGLGDDAARAERAALDAGRAAALRSGPLEAFVVEWEALPLFATQRALPAELQAQQRAARLAHDAAGIGLGASRWRASRRCQTCVRPWLRHGSGFAS